MDVLRGMDNLRNWEEWDNLKRKLDDAYKEEEMCWSQKARVQWLAEGNKNTKFFHASVVQRRNGNRIDQLEKKGMESIAGIRGR